MTCVIENKKTLAPGGMLEESLLIRVAGTVTDFKGLAKDVNYKDRATSDEALREPAKGYVVAYMRDR